MKIQTVFLAISIFFLFQFCKNATPPTQNTTTESSKPSNKTGKDLAEIYCSSCHQFPEPSLLDKKTWASDLLPNMGARLGVSTPNYTKE